MVVLSGILVGLTALVSTVGFLAWEWAKIPPQVPLFYSLPWGEGWLVTKPQIGYILGGFALVWVLNNLLAYFLSKDEVLLGSYLAWGSALVEILVLITILRTLAIIL